MDGEIRYLYQDQELTQDEQSQLGSKGQAHSFSDAELLTRARHGDDEAFSHLVQRHHRNLLHFCHSYFANPDEACDVVQVAFTRAWIKIADCERDFRPWLIKIARNHALDELRKPERRRTVSIPAQGDEAEFTGVSGAFDEAVVQLIDLTEAIANLPPCYRAVVELRLEGDNFDDIACRLGIGPCAARKRLERAKLALRSQLATGKCEIAANSSAD